MRKTTKHRGVILMISLWYLAGMSLLSVSFAHRVRLHLNVVHSTQRLKFQARYLARAAVTAAVSQLRADENEYDALNEPWATGGLIPWRDWFDGAAAYTPATDAIWLRVVDEERKVNINLMPEEVIARLPDLDEAQLASILDWRDEDDVTRYQGAETPWYLSRHPPRQCKDGALDFMAELLLVKGISENTYVGEDTNVNGLLDPNEDDGTANPPPDDADGIVDLGLRDILTVHGSGKINLNTAPPQALQAIPTLSEVVAEAVVEHRAGPDGQEGTSDDEPFVSFEELSNLRGISQYEIDLLSSVGTLSSNFFTIYAVGSVHGNKVRARITAVVERTDGSIKFVSWSER